MDGMAHGQQPPQEQGQEQPAQNDPAKAVQMIGSGLDQLISTAPSPELAQALEGVKDQIAQILSQAQGQAQAPVTPEQGGAQGAVPVR